MTEQSDIGRAEAVAKAARMADDGTYFDALAALVAHRTESQRPGSGPDLARYLNKEIHPRLTSLGFQCETFANSDPNGGPFLVARRIEDTAGPTVLLYGHGDVVNGQDDAWSAGRDPFALTRDGDRAYGRGSADNKSQHLINLLAMEAVLAQRGALGFNATVLIEMSEETGSPGLEAFCREQRSLLAADVLVASDGPRLQSDVPTLFMGARGGIPFDLVVDLRDGAHHSGNWGGLLADPAILLAHAIASITDKRGQIAIPEWRPDSLTASVRAALSGLPVAVADGPAIDEDWGEADLTPAERTFGWNSFAVLAMSSGVPDAPQNAISGRARATCQLRFVVGTDVEQLLPALRRHLDDAGFSRVRIEPREVPFTATRLDPDHPWVGFAAASLTRTAGRAPHILPNLAGSLPNHCFSEILDLPTIWVPHSYRGCSQHAPDEHVLLPLGREALQLMAGLYWDIGAMQRPAP